MSLANCNICLTSLNIKEDTIYSTNPCGHVFHHQCLVQALKTTSSCPQCRRPYIQNHQLFFSVENDDEEDEGAVARAPSDNIFLAKEMSKISKKIDNLSAQIATNNVSRKREQPPVHGGDVMQREIVNQLRRENADLKEILEMEKILSTDTEKEIENLKIEVRDRNDMINALQHQNELLKEETRLYEIRPRVAIDNLLDL